MSSSLARAPQTALYRNAIPSLSPGLRRESRLQKGKKESSFESSSSIQGSNPKLTYRDGLLMLMLDARYFFFFFFFCFGRCCPLFVVVRIVMPSYGRNIQERIVIPGAHDVGAPIVPEPEWKEHARDVFFVDKPPVIAKKERAEPSSIVASGGRQWRAASTATAFRRCRCEIRGSVPPGGQRLRWCRCPPPEPAQHGQNAEEGVRTVRPGGAAPAEEAAPSASSSTGT